MTVSAGSRRSASPHEPLLAAWFRSQGWTPSLFQREVWRRYLAGESGLIHTPTGSGKTLAAFGGPLIEALAEAAAEKSTRAKAPRARATAAASTRPQVATASVKRPRRRPDREKALRVLWVTPLRALALDTTRALREPIAALQIDWQVAMRTGDASARDRRLAKDGKAEVLVITPESLALLLTYADTAASFATLRCVVVDEWHELVGNKRGVLLQLCLARLRALAPDARHWGLSATLGNLDQARSVLLPHRPNAPIVAGARPRPVKIETLIPPPGARLPWAGYLGLAQLPRVVERLMKARTSLLFTNTRSQAELWHQALASVWPEGAETLALHHGSLGQELRTVAEQGLRDGTLRCVVATSSLDLGVDFPAVDQVIQIGSAKGIARLQQRAGRARHRPGESGQVACVPSHVLEMLEYAAVRRAMAAGRIESRPTLQLSLDVLAQHCVTLALGGGFDERVLLAEVRGTHAFAALDEAMWRAVIDFIVQGGQALTAYPDFQRVVRGEDGLYRVVDRKVAFRHRLSIGTITSDGSVTVKLLRGGRLGSVEESFVSRLRPGDRFQFAGRLLELFRLEDMVAHVRLAKGGQGAVPRWQGGRLPLSSELGSEVERLFCEAPEAPELKALGRVLELQATLSGLPNPSRLLAERIKARDGHHLFVYPFAGRLVHEGLAALVAMRWGRQVPNSFRYAANDYGFILSPANDEPLEVGTLRGLLSPKGLMEDLAESLNLSELARRQFREVARVAGLLPPSLPGKSPRSLRQLQASSGLIYDVLMRYDPGHVMLSQAAREVFSAQLDLASLSATLVDCERRKLMLFEPRGFTPLAFPLWSESLRGLVSTEDWKTRVKRAADQLEKRHGR